MPVIAIADMFGRADRPGELVSLLAEAERDDGLRGQRIHAAGRLRSDGSARRRL